MNPCTRAALITLLTLLTLSGCSDDPQDAPQDTNNAVNNDAPNNDINNDFPNNDGNNDVNNAPNNDAPNNDTNNDAPPAHDDSPLPEQPWPIDAPGFYKVGYRAMELTYTPEGFEEPRTIELAIWYPTRQLEGEPPKYMGLLPRQGVVLDASVAIEEAAPTLIFSHGHRGFAEQSYFMMEYFASHGWLVVAPSHTGNTLLDAIMPRPPQMFDWRAQDISQTLDLLEGLPAEDPLAGLIGQDVVLSGHSYGGYTTLAVSGGDFDVDGILGDCGRLGQDECAYISGEAGARYRAGFLDPRIKVAIPMAPGNSSVFGESGVSAIALPVMHMSGLLDISVTEERDGDRIWDQLDGPHDRRVQFLTGAHQTFANGCELVPGIGNDDGCGDEFLPTAEAHPIINAYAMAFARRHLFGDETDAALLDGQRSLSDQIVLHIKEAP